MLDKDQIAALARFKKAMTEDEADRRSAETVRQALRSTTPSPCGCLEDEGRTHRYYEQMMQSHEVPIKRKTKLPPRPVGNGGRKLNEDLIGKSPGSRNPGLDYVKQVYSERTGQE